MVSNEQRHDRVVITVLGSDRPGIVAEVSGALSRNNVNILDISQTILQELFTMTLICDLASAQTSFQELSDELSQLEEKLGVQINCQREEVFNFMYRL